MSLPHLVEHLTEELRELGARIVAGLGSCMLLVEDGRAIGIRDRAGAAHWVAGRKPIPGDGEPVLGAVGALPGCFVAFTHSGATLALIAGETATHEVMAGARRLLLESFSPDRFAS